MKEREQDKLDAKQLKVDTTAATAAGQAVDLYRKVKKDGWGGYAKEGCRNRAINAATYGWNPDFHYDNGPIVQSEDDESVLLVGHDIKFKNGFGAEGKGAYSCLVDKHTGSITILDHGIDPSAGN